MTSLFAEVEHARHVEAVAPSRPGDDEPPLEAARRFRVQRFERWGLDPDAVPYACPRAPWELHRGPATPDDQERAELARRQHLVRLGWTFVRGVPVRIDSFVARLAASRPPALPAERLAPLPLRFVRST